MSDGGNDQGDDLDFVYSPEQRLTAEQWIEVLESQVAECHRERRCPEKENVFEEPK